MSFALEYVCNFFAILIPVIILTGYFVKEIRKEIKDEKDEKDEKFIDITCNIIFLLFGSVYYYIIYVNIFKFLPYEYFGTPDIARKAYYFFIIIYILDIFVITLHIRLISKRRKEELLAIQAKEKEEEEHQTFVRRVREIEQAKAVGMAQGLILQYEAQLATLAEHKRQGLDIEKEAFELREKMIALEREENNNFMADMIGVVDMMIGAKK